jgi:GntR family transcriptional repressor for pyruvate dehydrogenase complex
MAALEYLKPISVDRPADLVFDQLRRLIVEGKLPPGERLASERQLAESFGLNRIHVREALQRLEFYGLVRTQRNVGAVVTQSGIRAVEGIFSDVLALSSDEADALCETRDLIEGQIVRLAVMRASDEDLARLEETQAAFEAAAERGADGLEFDLAFHLQLADAAGNPVLRALMGLLAPDLIQRARAVNECEGGRAVQSAAEHRAILNAISARDADAAAAALSGHLSSGAAKSR